MSARQFKGVDDKARRWDASGMPQGGGQWANENGKVWNGEDPRHDCFFGGCKMTQPVLCIPMVLYIYYIYIIYILYIIYIWNTLGL